MPIYSLGPKNITTTQKLLRTSPAHNGCNANEPASQRRAASGGAGRRAEDGGAAAVVGPLAERPTLLPLRLGSLVLGANDLRNEGTKLINQMRIFEEPRAHD
uniref:Uncharacterized protein n=1 Tax=Setaria viridis TaxID=4556 RepID=A0A4U6V0T9_SETVI|nr:hypothetical protein SEVIR_4G242602v2 [Setaria viridis]